MTAAGPLRLVVVGTSGAGKSHFARAAAQRLGCAHIELDALFWGPNWTPRPTEVFVAAAADAAAGEHWVIDGNYSIARDAVWPRATHVVWLDFNRATVLWRVLRRTVRRVVLRETLWSGNRESFRQAFASRASILLWSAGTFDKIRRRHRQFQAEGQPPQARWVVLRNPAEAAAWLQQLPAVRPSPTSDR